jgi:hypothetical protein
MSLLVTPDNKIITLDDKILSYPVNPQKIPNLLIWLDASIQNTGEANGGTVTTLINHAAVNSPTQTDNTRRATWLTGAQNGLPAFNFQGSTKFYNFPVLTPIRNKGAFVLILAYKRTSTDANMILFNATAGASNNRFTLVLNSNSSNINLTTRRLDAEAGGFVSFSHKDTNPHVLTAIANYTTNETIIRLDGVEKIRGVASATAGNTSNTDSSTLTVSSASNLVGHVYGMFGLDAIDMGNIAKLENYWKSRYNI